MKTGTKSGAFFNIRMSLRAITLALTLLHVPVHAETSSGSGEGIAGLVFLVFIFFLFKSLLFKDTGNDLVRCQACKFREKKKLFGDGCPKCGSKEPV